jgi:dTDP-L-rhamnose 4-epimerase
LSKHILITGGAGFIGSHLADLMLNLGYRVRALDNLSLQVHGTDRKRPEYLDPEVELLVGDVRDPQVMRHASERHRHRLPFCCRCRCRAKYV